MSTVVTVKTPAIRGRLTLAANENNPTLFIAVGSAYQEMELSANTMGEAIDKLMANIHRLQLTPEAKLAKQAKSIKMRETMARYHGKTNRVRSRTRVVEPNSGDTERTAS